MLLTNRPQYQIEEHLLHDAHLFLHVTHLLAPPLDRFDARHTHVNKLPGGNCSRLCLGRQLGVAGMKVAFPEVVTQEENKRLAVF